MHCSLWLAPFLVIAALAAAADPPPLMSTAQAMALPQPAPDHRLAYGPHELNFGELRLPPGEGPFPVVVVIHGGCWLAEYDLGYISALADRLRAAGYASWSIEYRRVGDEGGGWPGSFKDVAAAADALRGLARQYPLDLARVVALGHSAGGHLALWLGARPALDPSSPLRGADPLLLQGVISLAGITDLEAYAAPEGCGAAVPGLLGGAPASHPERLAQSSPMHMPPSGIPEILLIGSRDPIVPRAQAESYAAARARAQIQVEEIAGAGHFELVNPDHTSFSLIERSLQELFGSDPAHLKR